jgi:hypothetical protein
LAKNQATSSAASGMVSREVCSMLKALLVITSLVCCAGALFAPPPTAEDAARWSAFAVQSASRLGRSALSIGLSALPSSADVARYVGRARGRAESWVGNVLGNSRAPEAPASGEPQPSLATSECRLSELDAAFPQEPGQQSLAWISHEDLHCSADAKLPRPWCDPRVQAVVQLLEEDRVRRGDSASPLCSDDLGLIR